MLSVASRREVETETEHRKSDGRAWGVWSDKRRVAYSESHQTLAGRSCAAADRKNEGSHLPGSSRSHPDGFRQRVDRDPRAIALLSPVPLDRQDGTCFR